MIRHALGHLISCKQATQLVSRMQDRPLSGWDRLVLRLHLAVCTACSQFERQMRFLREAMAKYRQ